MCGSKCILLVYITKEVAMNMKKMLLFYKLNKKHFILVMYVTPHL